MKATDLKKWMEAHDKTEMDVACLVGLKDPRPIISFLRGETEPRRILIIALKKLIAGDAQANPGPKVA